MITAISERVTEHTNQSDCHLTASDIFKSSKIMNYWTIDHVLNFIFIYKDSMCKWKNYVMLLRTFEIFQMLASY